VQVNSELYGVNVAVSGTRRPVVLHRGSNVEQKRAAAIFWVETLVYPECGIISFPPKFRHLSTNTRNEQRYNQMAPWNAVFDKKLLAQVFKKFAPLTDATSFFRKACTNTAHALPLHSRAANVGFFVFGATTPSGPWPPHSRCF